MDHSQIDLKALALGEASPAEREAAAAFLAQSPEAQEEFDQLQFTLTALNSLRDEEIPRRIAFVSDPVFAPSLWQRFWASTPRLAFAGMSLLAIAITAHGFLMRPTTPMVIERTGMPTIDVEATVKKAVTEAVAAVEARSEDRVRQQVALAVSQTEKKFTQEIQLMSATMQENETILRKQLNRMYVTNAGLSVGTPKDSQ
jgi:hypothetical protein